MSDILIRKTGRSGRITLNRPDALNALTYKMCLAIEAAIDDWAVDEGVDLVVIDAAGEKAFCAGGDITQMYNTATKGDFDYGRRFWADEYRLNSKIAHYPKPYVAFMQGFTMGGGVGVSAHGSHRIVGATSRIAMPECGIGLVPDVGGSVLLACAPGRLGEYLGTTGARMGPGCAIYAGFADTFVPEERWPDVIAAVETTGDVSAIASAAQDAPASPLAAQQPEIDAHFAGETLRDIAITLRGSDSAFAAEARAKLERHAPLSLACAVEIIHRARSLKSLNACLALEYRFTYRSASDGDFIEGIRAQVIDKDRNPQWQHKTLEDVNAMDVAKMLLPLGAAELRI